MDRKALKEEKKKQKLEKFLNKKTTQSKISKAPKPAKNKSSSGYDPMPVEQKWNNYWLSNNLFEPQERSNKFVMCMPPPNITGSLHIGHSMMIAIQDAICRYMRLINYEVLYLPGTDHAGIATQTVVMKQLEKEKKTYNRESFLEATWKWKENYGSRILDQFKRLGTSADFSRQKFTMDAGMNKAVTEAFCSLYEKGLIYRDNKIVNWCCKLQTTLSDIEIDYLSVGKNTILKIDGRDYEFGVIYVFKYPVKFVKDGYESEGHIEVATTRPETILGDVALCANPKDARYTKYDKIIPRNPITEEELSFVFDEAAEMDLESGVLKITPAHDPIDFEIGKKNNLKNIKIFDNQNKIIIEGNYYKLKRLDARDLVVQTLKNKNLFVEKKPYEQVLPMCSRSSDLLEPVIKEQWWCSCSEMAKKAIDAVKTEQIKIYPEESRADWYRWFVNPRDWCLSRQLWWGHRIPAYKTPDGVWTIARNKEQAIRSYKKNNPLNAHYQESDFVQDEDVLDTWFSSGLWPFATLGWPNKNQDLDKYFPTSLLETGKDILFFWVGRMVMMSLELTGKVPFKKVLLHGIVRDAYGRKMSKSLGNVIDPIHVIDGASIETLLDALKLGNLTKENLINAESAVKKDFINGITVCGADALRFTLLSYMNGINDIKLDIERVKGNRKFCNKIWNAALFVKKIVDEIISSDSLSYQDLLNLDLSNEDDKLLVWLIQERNKVISTTHKAFKEYKFMSAVQSIHQFFLYDFCDVYIEIVKKIKTKKYIQACFMMLIDSIKIFSPYMPFITEEIYSQFFDNSLMYTSYPEIIHNKFSTNFKSTLSKIKAIRADIEKYGKEKVDVILDGCECFDKIDIQFISILIPNTNTIKFGERYEVKKVN